MVLIFYFIVIYFFIDIGAFGCFYWSWLWSFFCCCLLHFWCGWWLLSVGSTLREQPGPGPTTVGQLSPHSPSHRSPCGGVRAVSPLPKWARGILPDICYVFIAVYWEDENVVEWDWLGKYINYVEVYFSCWRIIIVLVLFIAFLQGKASS